jgi:cysteine desulfurase/selenocysteine lyase
MPRPGDTPAHPSTAATTPGIGLGAAQIPGGPTLPELDAVSLTRVVSQALNELFAAPPAGGLFPTPTPSPEPGSESGYTSSAPESRVPSFPAASEDSAIAPLAPDGGHLRLASLSPAGAIGARPAGAHSAGPFLAEPNFDALGPALDPGLAFDPGVLLSFALVDADGDLTRDEQPDAGRSQSQSVAPPPYSFETIPTALTTDVPAHSRRGGLFDANALKREFPILSEPVRGKRLVWLDNAATTQKPQAVIDRIKFFYEHENSNVHRAAHTLAARASDAYEAAREAVRRFLKAPSARDIVFVRGATEGINLVAQSWGRRNVGSGDEVVLTWLEHHANIVPWQQLCAEKGARVRVAPVDDRGQVRLEEYEKLLGPRTKIVSFTQVSNALGTITPAREMIDMAHRHGALVLLDGAQSVSHMPVDVQALGCDFFVFSGHKVFAPTGIGVVFGRSELLDAMPPWQGGGNMIQDVTFERALFQAAPARFEAGTGNIADAVGLAAALDWLSRVGVERVERYEHELLEYATGRLATVPGLTMIGTAPAKAGVLSFILDGQKTEEVGGMLDQEGIAVRSGHHCAQPILRRFGLEATVRASLAPYNTYADIDALVDALQRLQAGRPTRSRS